MGFVNVREQPDSRLFLTYSGNLSVLSLMATNRYKDWLAQAEDDLKWGEDSLKTGHFSQTCFIAQQIAEKALKSLSYKRGFEFVKGHSVMEICRSLDINGELMDAAKKLDQYYISTRYPDAMPSGAPFEFFTEDQAKESLLLAGKFLLKAKE